MALIQFRLPDDAVLQFVLGDTGAECQQFTAAVGAIAVHHHLIPFLLVEWLAVRHPQYPDLLTVGLRQVYFIVDTAGRVEIEGVVLESRALLVVSSVVVQSEGVVLGLRHRIGPHVVAVFQVLAHLFARQSQHKHQVLKPVELEHIALCHVACLDHTVEGQRGIKRDLRTRDLHLQVVDQVGKGGVAEETLTRINGVLETANLTRHVFLHGIDLGLEITEHLLVDCLFRHIDNLALDILLHQMAVLIRKRNLGLCHILHITAGIDAEHLLAGLVGNPQVMHLMVMSEEDDVESGHLLGDGLCGILLILVGLDATLQTRME